MPATQQKPDKKTVPQTATFHSKYANFTLIRKATGQDVLSGGVVRTVRKPVIYTFRSGTLVVSDLEKNYMPGRAPNDVLQDGPINPDTMEPEKLSAIEWLRQHPDFNNAFHEEGNEPGRPSPSDEEFFAAINEATIYGDVDLIQQMMAQEKATFQRESLIKAADSARKLVLRTRRELAEAEAAEEPPAAA